jgi:hypothetical protein
MTEHQCKRCGSSIEHVACDVCDGEGLDGHDCGEDCCCCADPEPNVQCQLCQGRGGWWRCLSGDEWCEENPLPGREGVIGGTPEAFEVSDSVRS